MNADRRRETGMAIGAAIDFLGGVYGEIQKISEEG